MRALGFLAVALGAAAIGHSATECEVCYGRIADSYRGTGMAQSFYAPRAETTIEDFANKNEYFHAASNTHYRMIQRGSRYFQRRWQVGFDGKETNVEEKQIDFVIGSGIHARTYLHRTERGSLVQLPLGWYAEKGGYWAMSPGYDSLHHPAAGRAIGYDCMFCHNAYPTTPPGQDRLGAEPIYSGTMPEGIDCARCHGPGAQHVKTAETAGAKLDDIRKAVVNPARLTVERQMEVCMQCHLQPTSFPLPNAVKRYDRGFFSYLPGEPLTSFMMYFDRAAESGQENRFEIASSAYRLRKSACFLKSSGKLQCTTCHDPHQPHGSKTGGYDAACRQCHTASFDSLVAAGKHVAGGNCASCHMPQRRTDDVVHVAMTDHYIERRRPAGDLLAEKPERERTEADEYRGVVVPYYPSSPQVGTSGALYAAVAQVRDRSNLKNGISQLTRILQTTLPKRPEPWFDLAEAHRSAKHWQAAISYYREALRRDPVYLPAMLAFGAVLKEAGRPREASALFQRATQAAPGDARAWNELGQLGASQAGRKDARRDALKRAIQLDATFAAPHNALGILAAQEGDFATAESEFREAIRILPSAGDAHGNLANLLAAKQDGMQALYEFDLAVRLLPKETTTRYRYAAVLNAMQRFDDARAQLEVLVKQDPPMGEAHDLLGNLYERAGDMDRALAEYRNAVRLRPDLDRAQLDLGATLAKAGDATGAAAHLRAAAKAADSTIRALATQLLAELPR